MTSAWVFKTEPTECSIDDLAAAGEQGVLWEGVRNYQARNFLRDQVNRFDSVLIHHSSCAEIGIVGLAQIIGTAETDPSQFQAHSPYYDPKSQPDKFAWYAVRVKFVEKFSRVLSLHELRQTPGLEMMQLVKKGNRLSVMPITEHELRLVLSLIQA